MNGILSDRFSAILGHIIVPREYTVQLDRVLRDIVRRIIGPQDIVPNVLTVQQDSVQSYTVQQDILLYNIL